MVQPYGVHTGYAPVNGAQLYYEVAGEGHALVLLHAGIADSRMWDDQFSVFARHFRVIRYDLRGHGRSDIPPGPFSSRGDLRGLLAVLGVERAHLVGLSVGGGIAIDFALDYPEVVTALIPVATGLSGYDASDELERREAEVEEAFEAGDLTRAVELDLRTWVDGPNRTFEQVDPAVRERVRAMLAELLARGPDEGIPQRLNPPAIGRLGEIRVPTLTIVGDQDVPDMLTITDLIATGVSAAKRHTIPGAAHMVNMERPEAFNEVVLEFLREV